MALTNSLSGTKKNQQQLLKTLDAFKEILRSANQGIIATDTQGIIVLFNPSAQRMLGYSEEEVVGNYTPLLFQDAEELAVRAASLSTELGRTVAPGFELLAAKFNAENANESEWSYISKDGSRFPVRLAVTSLYSLEETITGFLFTVTDITLAKEAEGRLKASEKLSQAVLETLSIQFCVLDPNGNILEANNAWFDFEKENKVGGTSQAFEAGQNYLKLLKSGLVCDRGGNAFAEGIRSVMNGAKSSFSLEYPYKTPFVQLWFTGKVIPCPDHGIGHVIVIHKNISGYKLLEHRFRQAVESAPNAIVMVNESGMIEMVNSQTEAFFGYTRYELIGQAVEILVPERFRGGHGSFRKAYFSAPQSRPMGAGRDLYGLRKDGTEFPVEIGLSFIEDENGRIALSSIADITERKLLEHRFRKAVESAPNAIVMVDDTGTILMVNSQTESYFGYSRHELIGQAVEILVPARFRGGHAGFRQAYFASPQSRPMGVGRDLYGLRKDGTEFPVEIGLSVIDDEKETIVLSTIIDITERKNANDKLKSAINEKETLLKEVYHRVKNNLQVVSSLINLQARNVKNNETADLLKQSADRIKSMALLHEKLYQSKDLSRINFNEYIQSLVDHLLYGYGAPGKINVGLNIDDIYLNVDTAIPCGLIINELLSNALKHAFPDGRQGEITISFTQDGDDCILVITDNGIGFPSGQDFKKNGSLGLQLVDTLTNQLMGQITYDSSIGSTFNIRFPLPF